MKLYNFIFIEFHFLTIFMVFPTVFMKKTKVKSKLDNEKY